MQLWKPRWLRQLQAGILSLLKKVKENFFQNVQSNHDLTKTFEMARRKNSKTILFVTFINYFTWQFQLNLNVKPSRTILIYFKTHFFIRILCEQN
jgi:hypothetical protein